MTAFDLDTAQNSSLWVVGGAVVVALLAVWVVKAVVTKVLTVVVLLAIAGLVYSQRVELTDCADQVRQTLSAGAENDTTCTFFGRSVTVPGRTTLLQPGTTTTTTTTP